MRNTHPKQTRPVSAVAMEVEDFVQIAEQEELRVEHMTIPGFLRRIPHRWNMEEIERFGFKVGRVTENMHLAYLTAVDRSLGVIRVFPVPLLERVYTVMAPQFGWPTLKALENAPEKEAARANERARRQLKVAAEHASDPKVTAALAVVMEWLDEDGAATPAPAETPPLRAL